MQTDGWRYRMNNSLRMQRRGSASAAKPLAYVKAAVYTEQPAGAI